MELSSNRANSIVRVGLRRGRETSRYDELSRKIFSSFYFWWPPNYLIEWHGTICRSRAFKRSFAPHHATVAKHKTVQCIPKQIISRCFSATMCWLPLPIIYTFWAKSIPFLLDIFRREAGTVEITEPISSNGSNLIPKISVWHKVGYPTIGTSMPQNASLVRTTRTIPHGMSIVPRNFLIWGIPAG